MRFSFKLEARRSPTLAGLTAAFVIAAVLMATALPTFLRVAATTAIASRPTGRTEQKQRGANYANQSFCFHTFTCARFGIVSSDVR
jgi:hypothetical protein